MTDNGLTAVQIKKMNHQKHSKKCELPLARRLMCWAHVIRKVRGHRTLFKNKDKFLLVEQNIMQLQLSFSDQIFVTAANLMVL
ncbi:unnamed protein product [Didymodactylos carnosus]|uniref:Transposase n=2 Tax=Didymodactylos carnosus TaxID=1234261 RepID=A0A8S2F2E1_9BILA|nr:unnamed protein product [Didymodactylos carnosus]CAF4111520.1 unnamed protein product [Didymodactylos carnosus]